MKKYIKQLSSFVACSIMAISCMNFEPQAQLADTNIWQDASDFKLFANQFYDYLGGITIASSYSNKYNDFNSDLLTSSTPYETSAGNIQIPTTDSDYTNAYKNLYNCNLLISKAESYDGGDIDLYVAEAKFFRAYVYSDLLQFYGDAVIVTTPMDLDSPELNAARNDRSEVADQIISDLNDAIASLPLASAVTESGRVSKGAALSLLARIALFEGTWQKYHYNNTTRAAELFQIAIDAADAVIASKEYSLFQSDQLIDENGVDKSYKYLFTLENTTCNPAGLTKSSNKEYILIKAYDEVLYPVGVNITHGVSLNVHKIARKFANMFLCQDGLPIDISPLFGEYLGATSEFENRDNRMYNIMYQYGDIVWDNESNTCRYGADGTTYTESRGREFTTFAATGYESQKWAVEREVVDTYEGFDYPLIRYAEVLLTYAEACYELNGAITNTELDYSLNLVRARVNPTMTPLSTELVAANSLDMLEEIRRERTIELFSEGFRLGDLKRWKTAEIEMPMDLLGVKWSGTAIESIWTTASEFTKNEDGCIVHQSDRVFLDRHYLHPLPSEELQKYSNWEQNPGWGE